MDKRIEGWIASYRALAEKVVDEHVRAIQQEFPDERYPVRTPYRKAVYNHLLQIVDDLVREMDELLEESPDETDDELKACLSSLQEEYERDFSTRTRKEKEGNDE